MRPLRTLLTSALFLGLALPALAIDASETDARAVMEAVEAQETGDRQTSRIEITVTDKAGRERKRSVVTRSMDFEGGNRQLILFEAPADVRNAGLLSVDYDDSSKTDDQWLFLPSLSKSSRISGSDRSGSFMGTDLTYADMGGRDLDDYEYVMVDANAEVDGEPCWIIESRAVSDKERDVTGYLKSQSWNSKEKMLPIQVKAWVIEGKMLKYTRFDEIKQINGIWVPHSVVVRTVKGSEVQSTSTLTFSDVAFDQEDVTQDDFTERRLERGL